MRIVIVCEHFYPLGGGVAKYMQELAIGLKKKKYDITVATGFSDLRIKNEFNDIPIYSFKVKGNSTNGIVGDVENYQSFFRDKKFDFIIVMAAQQWTFDALIPIIDEIKSKIIHIPCGYSYFYDKKFAAYYQEMRQVLPKISALVYHATNYHDINFAREQNLQNIHIIPAGVNLEEFNDHNNINIRKKLGIDEDNFIYFSVGAPAYNKGQKELLLAYQSAHLDFKSTLILNSYYQSSKLTIKEIIKTILGRSIFNIKLLALKKLNSNKKVILVELPRNELVTLYFHSDLFVFPSHVEYSPLVIFEAMAAGLPFIANPVGNCEEIIDWSQAGLLINKVKVVGERKIAEVDAIKDLLETIPKDKELLHKMSENGKHVVNDRFNWDQIINEFVKVIEAIK